MTYREIEVKKAAYFETLGWDERDIPKTDIIQRLSPEDPEPRVKAFRE